MGQLDDKIKVLEDKVVRVQDVVKETVQFSNRTYFMEEARTLRGEKERTEKELSLCRDKLRHARKRVQELEGILTDYQQKESGLVVGANFGQEEDGLEEEEEVEDLKDTITDVVGGMQAAASEEISLAGGSQKPYNI